MAVTTDDANQLMDVQIELDFEVFCIYFPKLGDGERLQEFFTTFQIFFSNYAINNVNKKLF